MAVIQRDSAHHRLFQMFYFRMKYDERLSPEISRFEERITTTIVFCWMICGVLSSSECGIHTMTEERGVVFLY